MWPNPQFPADLVIITEEIFNGKLHFLFSGLYTLKPWKRLWFSYVFRVHKKDFWHEVSYVSLPFVDFNFILVSNFLVSYLIFHCLENTFIISCLLRCCITTAQKMKFSIKDFFSNCSFPRIWPHLLKECLMEKFNFCAAYSIEIFFFIDPQSF